MNDRKKISLLAILLVTWQLLLVFQGLDLADTGFHLSAFRFILEEPYSVQYSMSFWLSDILGHVWMQVWPAGGLLWCRLGAVAIFSTAFYVYFRLLREEVGSLKAISGLFIIALFMLKGGFECLNYDIFSMLGYGIAVTLFVKGLMRENKWFLLLAGVALGVNLFLKLTNMAGLLFFLLIPFYMYIKRKRFGEIIMLTLPALAGFMAGAGIVLALIGGLGHWGLFFNNLEFLFGIAGDEEASHGLSHLLNTYASGFLNAFLMLALFLFAAWGFTKIPDKGSMLAGKIAQRLLLLFAISASFVLMLLFREVFWSKVRYLLLGLVMLGGVQYAFNKEQTTGLRLLSMTGLLLFLAVPLGSDSWLGKSMHGMWILGALLLSDIDLKTLGRPLKIKATKLQEQIIKNILIGVVLTSSLVYAWQNTYFDAGSRIQKHYPVQHSKLQGIYTTESRARVINELITEAFPKIEEEYLLAFIEIPMINYLADKKPYLSTSWPKLYYSPDAFRRKLEEAYKKRDALPAIIRQKQNTMLEAWPMDRAEPGYLDYPEEMSKWPEHGKILNEFIVEHGYTLAWENEMFQMLRISRKGKVTDSLTRSFYLSTDDTDGKDWFACAHWMSRKNAKTQICIRYVNKF